MPTATRRRGRPRKEETALDRELANLDLDNPDAIPAAAGELQLFDPFDEALRFFDAIQMLTATDWERYLLYLYRVEPKVRNSAGEPAFIDKFKEGIDEDDVKARHGGGKYMFIFKDDFRQKRDPALPKPRERSHLFRIDGEPLFQPGQTRIDGQQPAATGVVLPPTAPLPSGDGHTDIAAVLREFVTALRDQTKTQDPEVVRKSYDMALDVVRDAAKRESGSMTGNPTLDLVFTKLLERSLDPHDKGTDRLIAKLEAIGERLANPQPASNGGDVLDQLGGLKDLLGVDSILDLIRPDSGGNAWKADLAKAGIQLVGVLPQIIGAIMQNQERQFQRAKEVEMLRHGQVPPPPPIPGRVAVPPHPGQVAGVPQPSEPLGPIAVPEVEALNPVAMMVHDIAFLFETGLGGDAAADFIDRKYGEQLGVFKSMLSDVDQVRQFCLQTAPLAEIAMDPESKVDFDHFLQEFVKQFVTPAEEPEPVA